MKKVSLLFVAIMGMIASKADEGMWLPFLINQNYAAMQKMGFTGSAEQLYSINNASMKDAIVHFGGGCTAEVISKQGLLLTNHHCGYDAIAGLSTVDKNYLMNGYAAQNAEQELPCPGLTVRFFVRVEDVTDAVMKLNKKTKKESFEKKFEKYYKAMEDAQKALGYEVDIKPFFGGNKYYMMVFERFTDVRLVATPQENLGKFGGDTDNWMWPRHTCDFSMFRIYSNNENKPAAYSKNNRAYQPKYALPISTKGVKEGDFSMVYGYPGRTTRYMSSYGVNYAVNESNPAVVKIRTKRLAIMREEMDKDEATNLKYASGYASIANYWKYYIGQTEQLKNLRVLETKQKQEVEFLKWAGADKTYNTVFDAYKTAYDNYTPYSKHATYYREAFMAPVLTKLAGAFYNIQDMYSKKETPEKIKEAVAKIKIMQKGSLKSMDLMTDKKLFSAMNLMFYQDVPKNQQSSIFSDEIFKRFGGADWQKTFNDYTEYVYSNTSLLDATKLDSLLANLNADNLKADPAVQFALNVMSNYKDNYEKKGTEFMTQKGEIDKTFIAGLMKKNEGQLMYPDANSTLRISYGQVKAYQPKDAVSFNYYTTAQGLLEKYKPKDAEFELQQNIVDLLTNKDYGSYADPATKELVTCFITNNDITGGNSGSPVINGNGELIGAAFDGNWEAMSGDISFDQKYKRTIVVDIRYIMWVVDKVLGGGRIFDEVEVRNK
jgi:predicted acetyltransferase